MIDESHKCFVEGCEYNENDTDSVKNKKIAFHRLPPNKELRNKWIHSIREGNSQIIDEDIETFFICSLHFGIDSYAGGKGVRALLLTEAIPFKFQNDKSNDSDLILPTSSSSAVLSDKMRSFRFLGDYKLNDLVDNATNCSNFFKLVQSFQQKNLAEKKHFNYVISKLKEKLTTTEQLLREFQERETLTNSIFGKTTVPNIITSKSCLVCLHKKGTVSVFSQQTSLADKIRNLADITILKDDRFPISVCSDCALKINDGYKLKKQCQYSIKIFTNSLKLEKSTVDKNCEQLDSIKENTKEKISSNSDSETDIEDIKPSIEELKTQFCSVFFPDVKITETDEIKPNNINYIDDIKQEPCIAISDLILPIEEVVVDEVHKDSTLIENILPDSSTKTCEERNKKNETDDKTKNFKCDQCPKEYKLKIQLSSHKRYHKRESAFICEICSKEFKAKQSLNLHKLIHEPPQYKCDKCDKLIYNPFEMRRHAKAHEQKKEEKIYFPCDKCDQILSSKSSLIKHVKSIHLGITKFTCIVCEKGYYNSSNYQLHLRSHSGEKPFECEVCKKKFAQQPVLKAHLLKQHNIKSIMRKVAKRGAKIYKCPICNKLLSTPVNLKKHITIIHSDTKKCST